MQQPPRCERTARRLGAASLTTLMIAVGATDGAALEVLANEKAGREACQRRACEIIVSKDVAGPPLVCDMTKTWDRDKIKKGSDKKRITWGFGDARCEMSLKLERSLIVPALVERKHTLQFPPQLIRCVVENESGKAKPLLVTASPKVKFKNGEAYKVWLNVSAIEGEGMVKNLVWSAAKLADGLGIFHSDTLKGINGFVRETCPGEALKPRTDAVKAEKAIKPPAAKPAKQASQ